MAGRLLGLVAEGAVMRMKKRDWEVRGRLLSKLVRGVFIGVWYLRIGVRDGVFLQSGSVFDACMWGLRFLRYAFVEFLESWSFVRYKGVFQIFGM